jgi:hypothetical protein
MTMNSRSCLLVMCASLSFAIPTFAGTEAAAQTPDTEVKCRKEFISGSRIRRTVCPGDAGYNDGARFGEQLRRPGDRQFTRSMQFPGLEVNVGTGAGVSIHQ